MEDQPEPAPAAPVNNSEQLSQGEHEAKLAMGATAEELQGVMIQALQRAGGVNIMATELTTKMLAAQFEALVTVLFQVAPQTREIFWRKTAENFSNMASQYRQALIAQPAIMPAGGSFNRRQ